MLLMSKDSTTVHTLSTVMENHQDVALAAVCLETSELTNYLSNMELSVVVVDIDPDPLRILHDLNTITAMYPETRIVVASNRDDKECILQAMQSGARHFLSKKSIASELNKILKQIVSNGAENEARSGSIVSVISTSGGCGATTVAINLANELRLASSEAILTIDLDDYYGAISSYLGISAEYGISDVLSRNDAIDNHLVRSCAHNYMQDFHVLGNRNNSEFLKQGMSRHKNIVPVLQACKKAYKYTIVDAPRLAEDTIEDLVTISDFVLIVFQLTVKDVKFARFLMASIQSWTSNEKIFLLANRFKKRGSPIGLEDGKQVLGLDCIYRLRSDWSRITKCVIHGKPLSEVAPRSKLRQDFQKLSAAIETAGKNNNGINSG
jgi:pilus assembly protein CpaE